MNRRDLFRNIFALGVVSALPAMPKAAETVTFSSRGTWTVPEGITNVRVMVRQAGGGEAWREVESVKDLEPIELNGLKPGTSYDLSVGFASAPGPGWFSPA